jgi:hypothetical protein
MLLPVFLGVHLLPFSIICTEIVIPLKRETLHWTFSKFTSEDDYGVLLKNPKTVCELPYIISQRYFPSLSRRSQIRNLHGKEVQQLVLILNHGQKEET